MSDRQTLPVIEMVRGQTRLKLVAGVLGELDETEWYRSGQLADRLDTSQESLRKHLPPLVSFGCYEVRDPEAKIPHYRVADSPVVALLGEYHDSETPPLTELLDTTPIRVLTEFFLIRADPEQSYSRNKLQQITEAGFHGIKNNIDRLVEAGVLDTVEGTRGTEYRVVPDSPVVRFLMQLNEAAYEEHRRD